MTTEPKPQKIAYRIQTERTNLRCYMPSDCHELHRAVVENIDHLKPWLPWLAEEPISIEKRISLLRSFRALFDRDEDYVLGIFDTDNKTLLGGSGFHKRRGPGALELGYWITAEHAKKGIVTEVAAALTRVAFELYKVERVEVHCDPKNLPSLRIPKRLGFTHEATLKNRLRLNDDTVDSMVWTMFEEDFDSSEASLRSQGIQVFDCLDQAID